MLHAVRDVKVIYAQILISVSDGNRIGGKYERKFNVISINLPYNGTIPMNPFNCRGFLRRVKEVYL